MAEAKSRICDELSKGPLTQLGYTYVDDGWTSRAKRHMTAAFICRPGTPGQLLFIKPVNPWALHAVAISRDWKNFIIQTGDSVQTEKVDTGTKPYVCIPNRPPEPFYSDSARISIRARRIWAARHSYIVFIPCFLHFSVLQC